MTLPAWLDPLPDPEQQREIDRWAIETLGTPSEELMERAGTALADAITAAPRPGPVAVVVYKGNNGGDGRVVARRLTDAGADVRLIDVSEADLGVAQGLDGAAVVVDALLGTGFSGAPREPVASAITAINAAHDEGATVYATDIPSGVDGASGEVRDAAVQADHTVTFHAAPPGLWISPGKDHVGALAIADIGIPAEGAPVQPGVGLISDRVLAEIPRREAGSNKFTNGHVLIVAGSERYTGAPAMVAMSAARAGAGYVTVSVPPAVIPVLQAKLLEPMVTDRDSAPEMLDRADVLVIGAGLGRETDAPALVRFFIDAADCPLLLDADGLNALAGDLEALSGRTAPTVLTPHVGEMAKLLDVPSAEVNAQRRQCAERAARRSGAIVVLKGDDTIVAHPDGRIAISPGGVPALATAGTGDVLGGVIGAYLGKKMDPFAAACAGVLVHLRAGALAAREVGAEGVVASDVITQLPRVMEAPSGKGL